MGYDIVPCCVSWFSFSVLPMGTGRNGPWLMASQVLMLTPTVRLGARDAWSGLKKRGRTLRQDHQCSVPGVFPALLIVSRKDNRGT